MNYENLRLEKSMYRIPGKTFTQVLEAMDPDINYKGTSLEGLDAFQRQLKRFDIKVSGEKSDVVEKFFQTSDSAALFPEYVSRAIRQGMEESDIISRIVATKTMIDGLDYRTVATSTTESSLTPAKVLEGGTIPETVISTQENLVTLTKRGRMIVASYEAIRFQRLDLVTVTLKQIGSHITSALIADAVGAIIDGDGNSNAAPITLTSSVGTVTYNDLITFWAQFSPYELNCLLVSDDMMLKLLAVEEFKNPLTGLNFQGTGRLTTPLGAELIRCSALPANTIIGLDRRYALEMVQSGNILVESDKLIDRQLERTAVTVIAGFSKIYSGASNILMCKTN